MTTFQALTLDDRKNLDNTDNQKWWESNPMTYDWTGELGQIRLDLDYFRGIDQIFGYGHSLINNPNWPNGNILENFIPYQKFQSKNVLEIGCGAGLVASHIARAGANLTAIDLTKQALELTKARFDLMNLKGQILQMNAEQMEFADASFDYVVSWGVIHHSGNMQAILDEIYRVLKPGGQAFIMVYNKNSLRYQVFCRFWLGVVKFKFLKNNLQTIVGSITDGYIARHLTCHEFAHMASRFKVVDITYSDEIDTISYYLLGFLCKIISHLPRFLERWLAKKWGWYLEAQLTK